MLGAVGFYVSTYIIIFNVCVWLSIYIYNTLKTYTPACSCRSITSTQRASGAKNPEAGLPPLMLVVSPPLLLLPPPPLPLPGCFDHGRWVYVSGSVGGHSRQFHG